MDWITLEKDDAGKILAEVRAQALPGMFESPLTEVRRAELHFYDGYHLYRLTNYATLPAFSMDFLSNGTHFVYLDGAPETIRRFNESGKGALSLDEGNVFSYLDFFCRYGTGPDGEEMSLLDSLKEHPFLDGAEISGLLDYAPRSYADATIRRTTDKKTKAEYFEVACPLYFGGALIDASLVIDLEGRVEVTASRMMLTHPKGKGGVDALSGIK